MTDVCFRNAAEAIAATGTKLTKKELETVRDDVDKILNQRAAGVSQEEAMQEVRRAAMARIKSAKLMRASAVENFNKTQSIISNIMQNSITRPWAALRALIDSDGGDVLPGMKHSVRVIENGLIRKYWGGIMDDIRRGHGDETWKLFMSGAVDKEVSRVLFEMSYKGGDVNGLLASGRASQSAKNIADVLHKYQKIQILDANRRLIPLHVDDFFITSQTHDGAAIKRAKFDAWFAVFEKTFSLRYAATPQEFRHVAENFYNDITAGVFVKDRTGAVDKGYRSRAAMTAPERSFIPKSADAWFDYNKAFGSGNLRETYASVMKRRAKDFAFVDVLGTTPEKAFWEIFDTVSDRLRDRPEVRSKLANERKSIENLLHTANGMVDEPARETLAKYMSASRGMTRMAIYGGSLLSQPPDLAIAASELRYQGWDKTGGATSRGLLSGIFDMMKGLTIGENKTALRYLKYVADDFINYIGEADRHMRGVAGWTNRQQSRFFTLNAQSWWTNRMRAQHEVLTASTLAEWKGKTFDQLPSNTQKLFSAHNISADAWDVMRKGVQKAEDGLELITPEGISNLDDAVFAAFKTKTSDLRSVERIRDDITDQYRAYVLDRMNEGLSTPGYRERAIMLQGSQAGTPIGEAWRSFAMAKTFPTAVLVRGIQRELYGYGADNIYQAFKAGDHGRGFTNLMVFATLLGYMSMTARDMLAGKEPRDPLDPRTWTVAMARGGALGFYGDLLFGMSEKRIGMNAVTGLLGPQVQQFSDFAGLLTDITKISNRRDETRVGADALRFVYRNLPGNNLFYVKPVVDYGFMFGVMEAMKPGYLREMEKRWQQNTGANYWAPPSTTAAPSPF